jgi:hypothetical protein
MSKTPLNIKATPRSIEGRNVPEGRWLRIVGMAKSSAIERREKSLFAPGRV